MKPSLTINVNLSTRKALYTPSSYNATKYHLSTDEPTEVDVFGLFQCGDTDGSDAYFVVKLPDGKCCYADVNQIQFLPEEEEVE
jgi:hypothetical protein